MAVRDYQANRAVLARFERALDRFVEAAKGDEAILGAVLCGSLAHDRVWQHSDIDLVLITIDDAKIKSSGMACTEEEVNIHVELLPRATFRQLVEGSQHNSFMHSLLAKGRLLYSHDPSLEPLLASLHEIGERDTRLQLLRAAACVVPCWYKAIKWYLTRGDLRYSTFFLLQAAIPLARIEIISRGLLADREVLPQAMELNPEFFRLVYHDRLSTSPDEATLVAALDAVDDYLTVRIQDLFAPLLDYLAEAEDVRSIREIDHYCRRQYDLEEAAFACEFLSDKGIIGKAAVSANLTKVSTTSVQEMGFYSLQDPTDPDPPDAF